MSGATVIIGAGFAGIATAYHLARRNVRDIVVLEREEGPGMHASGRNAGLLRQSSSDPATAELLRTGARAARTGSSGPRRGPRESGRSRSRAAVRSARSRCWESHSDSNGSSVSRS